VWFPAVGTSWCEVLAPGAFGLAGVTVVLLSGMLLSAQLAERPFFAVVLQVAEALTSQALRCWGGREEFLYSYAYPGDIESISDSPLYFFFCTKGNGNRASPLGLSSVC
jgi:hypothetical protein